LSPQQEAPQEPPPAQGSWVLVSGWTALHAVRPLDPGTTLCGREVSGSITPFGLDSGIRRCGRCLASLRPVRGVLAEPPPPAPSTPGLLADPDLPPEWVESRPEELVFTLPPEPPIGSSVEVIGGGMTGQVFTRIRVNVPPGQDPDRVSAWRGRDREVSDVPAPCLSWGVLLASCPGVVLLRPEASPALLTQARSLVRARVRHWPDPIPPGLAQQVRNSREGSAGPGSPDQES
jgi:hypothetical protein